MTRKWGWICALSWIAMMLSGCGSPPKERFYTLGNPPASVAADEQRAHYSVAVGPITVPEAVDRPQMVVRVAANRVEISETHRWAEPLKSAIAGTLVHALVGELGATQIAPHSQFAGPDADFQVMLDVQRFESAVGEAASIEALWSVRRAKKGEVRTGRSLVREPVSSRGYDEIAAAHGRALQQLAREIARAVRAMQ